MKFTLDLRVALVLLGLGVIHEMAWQFWPGEFQGDIEVITRWPLIVALCALVAIACRSANITAVCVCLAIMSSTSALCSLWFVLDPWIPSDEGEQCSVKWGPLSMAISVIAAGFTLLYLKVMNTPDPEDGEAELP